MAPQRSALAVIKMAGHIHRAVRPRKKGSNTNHSKWRERTAGKSTGCKHKPFTTPKRTHTSVSDVYLTASLMCTRLLHVYTWEYRQQCSWHSPTTPVSRLSEGPWTNGLQTLCVLLGQPWKLLQKLLTPLSVLKCFLL